MTGLPLTLEQTLVACLALHVLADFPIQTLGTPSLADLKQKRWWGTALERYAPAAKNPAANVMRRMYRNDYKVALACHSLVWAVITFLPMCLLPGWSAIVAVNAVVHYVVDDMKANSCRISLVTDQLLHCMQMLLTVGLTLGLVQVSGGVQP